MNKAIKLINKLSMIFPDPVIEKEFRTVQKKDMMQDFQATVIVILLVTIATSVQSAVKWNQTDFIISMLTNGCLIVVFCFQRLLRKNIQLLTLAVLVVYNAYRILYLNFSFSRLGKISMHNAGYSFAVLQMILIYHVPNIHFKIVAVIATFLYRFLLIWELIDPMSAQPGSIVRSVFIDAFILYFYYTQERKQRAVFQHYAENREELLKFKDMLADFPQSIAVIDSTVSKSLFVNKTYTNVFHGPIVVSQSQQNLDTIQTQPPVSHQDISKLYFSLLRVDHASIKQIESLQTSKSFETGGNSVNLKNFMEVLIKENLLKDQGLTVTANAKWQGQIKAFQVILKKVKWDRVDAVAVILNDITEQQNNITLKIANANKDKYIATVSHEFRTPLHGIIGLLEISEKQQKKAGIMKYLSLCKDNANLLLGLVNSMLAFHQSTTGKLRVKPEKVNLRKHLENVLKLFQFQAQQKKIYLKLAITKEIPEYIITDIERLKEILIQLIGNAVKFTSEGGINVEVAMDMDDEKSIRFFVADTGKGIKKEDQKKLFQLNSINGTGHSVNNKGVGLGLTISNSLALILSGQTCGQGIQVQSKYNQGSVFSFKILKELTVQAGIEASLHLRRLRSSEDRNSYDMNEDDDEDQKILGEEMYPMRRESQKIDYYDDIDDSEKAPRREYYEELLSPTNLESKLSSYISRNKINLGDLKVNFKASSTLSPTKEETKKMSDTQANEPEKISPNIKGETSVELQIRKKQTSSPPELIIDGSVLVVDDNPFNLLIAWNLLKDLGFPVITAMGGKEAINSVKECFAEGINLKLILMDCQMPILDGYETTKILRKMMNEGEVQTVPILAWTANDSQEDVSRCYECGMVGHITKPTTRELLIKTLSQVYT